jgi:hypothetical protein
VAEKVKRPTGRPPGDFIYDPYEWIPVLLAAVRGGMLLRTWCLIDGHPCWNTVYKWRDGNDGRFERQFDPIEGFADALRAAREGCYDVMAEDVPRIADGDDFKPLGDPKLRVDSRVRMLGRWSHRFSEKRQVENTGTGTVQIVTGVPDPEPKRSSLLD